MEDGDGGGVKPRWTLTFGHMVKKLCAICVKYFGHCCDVEIHAAVIQLSQFGGREMFAAPSAIHDVRVVRSFGDLNEGGSESKACVGGAERFPKRHNPLTLNILYWGVSMLSRCVKVRIRQFVSSNVSESVESVLRPGWSTNG